MITTLNVRHVAKVKRRKTTVCADCDRALLNGKPAIYFCVRDREYGNGIPYGLYICPRCFEENTGYQKAKQEYLDRRMKKVA